MQLQCSRRRGLRMFSTPEADKLGPDKACLRERARGCVHEGFMAAFRPSSQPRDALVIHADILIGRSEE